MKLVTDAEMNRAETRAYIRETMDAPSRTIVLNIQAATVVDLYGIAERTAKMMCEGETPDYELPMRGGLPQELRVAVDAGLGFTANLLHQFHAEKTIRPQLPLAKVQGPDSIPVAYPISVELLDECRALASWYGHEPTRFMSWALDHRLAILHMVDDVESHFPGDLNPQPLQLRLEANFRAAKASSLVLPRPGQTIIPFPEHAAKFLRECSSDNLVVLTACASAVLRPPTGDHESADSAPRAFRRSALSALRAIYAHSMCNDAPQGVPVPFERDFLEILREDVQRTVTAKVDVGVALAACIVLAGELTPDDVAAACGLVV